MRQFSKQRPTFKKPPYQGLVYNIEPVSIDNNNNNFRVSNIRVSNRTLRRD